MRNNKIQITRGDVDMMVYEVVRRLLREDCVTDFEEVYEDESRFIGEYTRGLSEFISENFPQATITGEEIASRLTELGGLKNDGIDVAVFLSGNVAWEEPDEDGYSFRYHVSDGTPGEADYKEYREACRTLSSENEEAAQILEAFNDKLSDGINFYLEEYSGEDDWGQVRDVVDDAQYYND